jgi:hypothetical protein
MNPVPPAIEAVLSTHSVRNVVLGPENCRVLEFLILWESFKYRGLFLGKSMEIELVWWNGCLSTWRRWCTRCGLFGGGCLSNHIHPCNRATEKVEHWIQIDDIYSCEYSERQWRGEGIIRSIREDNNIRVYLLNSCRQEDATRKSIYQQCFGKNYFGILVSLDSCVINRERNHNSGN